MLSGRGKFWSSPTSMDVTKNKITLTDQKKNIFPIFHGFAFASCSMVVYSKRSVDVNDCTQWTLGASGLSKNTVAATPKAIEMTPAMN